MLEDPKSRETLALKQLSRAGGALLRAQTDVSFVDQCMLVIENSSREQTRQETDQMDETLNEEETTIHTDSVAIEFIRWG